MGVCSYILALAIIASGIAVIGGIDLPEGKSSNCSILTTSGRAFAEISDLEAQYRINILKFVLPNIYVK